MIIQSASPTISSVNSGGNVLVGGSVSILTALMSTATGATVGGKTLTSFSGSSNSFTAVMPDRVDGGTYPPYGNNTCVITDGVNSPSITVPLTQKATELYTTLTSVISTIGYLSYYFQLATGSPMTSGDTITFRTATDLGVTRNQVNNDSGVDTDYVGTQTFWHRNVSTGVITQLNVNTALADVTIGNFTLPISTPISIAVSCPITIYH